MFVKFQRNGHARGHVCPGFLIIKTHCIVLLLEDVDLFWLSNLGVRRTPGYEHSWPWAKLVARHIEKHYCCSLDATPFNSRNRSSEFEIARQNERSLIPALLTCSLIFHIPTQKIPIFINNIILFQLVKQKNQDRNSSWIREISFYKFNESTKLASMDQINFLCAPDILLSQLTNNNPISVAKQKGEISEEERKHLFPSDSFELGFIFSGLVVSI